MSRLQLSRPTALIVAVGLALVVGYVDLRTGTEVHDDVLYFVPLALAAVYAGRTGAILVSSFAAVVWGVSNWLGGVPASAGYLWLVNVVLQTVVFLTVTLLIAQTRRSFDRERELARVDPLTQLANSRAFFEQTRLEIARARRRGRPLSVAYLDLDNFKTVNDTSGHETGDRLLRVIAGTLRSTVRATDFVARLGGDEFAVLLPELSPDECQPLVERLCRRVADTMTAHGWPVTVSVGAVTWTDVPDAAAVVGRADALMYQAKRAGKNRAHFEVASKVAGANVA